jgi:DNA-binding FadR family transcriptional regulator
MSARSAGEPKPLSPLTPVPRAGLTDRVIEQLRDRIGDGTWALRQRLPAEAALAAELGVGRSTIREAVRVLVHAGLLEVRQGDGTFVRSQREIDVALQRRVLRSDPLEVYQVRRALEIEAARLAAEHRSEADLVRLRELASVREAAYHADWAQYRKANAALRQQILQAAGNPLLADLYRGTVDALQQANSRYVDDAELTRDDPDRPETPELLDAIEKGDPQAAAAAAQRHMDNVLRVLRFVLQAIVTTP